MKRSRKIAIITWIIVIILAITATITVLYMHVRKKDTKFEMTNEIKNAMSILVLYEYGGHTYDNLEILDDRGMWEEYFIHNFLLNNTYSFAYLDKISDENDGKIPRKDAEDMQYSLTGRHMTFTSKDSENIDRHNLNDYTEGSYATFQYCDFTEDGDEVTGTAKYTIYYSLVVDDNGESDFLPVETYINFELKKNPDSCFDGYSFVKLEIMDDGKEDDEANDESDAKNIPEEEKEAESEIKPEEEVEPESEITPEEETESESEIKTEETIKLPENKTKSQEPQETKTSSLNDFGPITTEEYNSFKKTCDDTVDTNKMQDIAALMTKDYTGTWYDPSNGEAIRLSSEGAYVYIPYLDMYGDTLYQWKLVDRSAKGACPMLEIKCWGPDTGGLAYYVAGYNENYFYGKLQGYVFYKQ